MGEFLKGWRRNAVRIATGVVLVLAVYGALLVWVPYQRELRIAKEIRAFGGDVDWEYVGPSWIPQSIQDRTTLLNRVTELYLYKTKVTDADLEQRNGLTNLRVLYLCSTQVTDAGLGHLKGLTNLSLLDLGNLQVTDAGLEHLKGLNNLKSLYVLNTQTTAEGRAMLRKALPNCRIFPEP